MRLPGFLRRSKTVSAPPPSPQPAHSQRAMGGIPRDLLKQVKQIELNTRGLVNSTFSGEYQSVFRGQGMEFAEVREYQPGDDVRNIDWNVTARTGVAHLKKHIEERELTVMLLVDLSGSEQFGTHERFKAERAAEIAAVLALSAVRNNDRVGLLIFTDHIEHVVPPKKGRRHVLRIIRDVHRGGFMIYYGAPTFFVDVTDIWLEPRRAPSRGGVRAERLRAVVSTR